MLKWQYRRLRRPESLKQSKTKSIEKMLSSLPCKRQRRKLRRLLKSLGKSKRKKLISKDSGMLSWLKELNRRRKTKKPLSLLSNKKLPGRKPTEKQLLPKRKLKRRPKELLISSSRNLRRTESERSRRRDKKQNKQSELKSNINSKRPSPESKPWRKLLEKRLSKKD
jgi:hypothetical protein